MVEPGALYCQSGKPPMQNYFANGDSHDDGWQKFDSQSPDKDDTVSGLHKKIDEWAISHPVFNIAACEMGCVGVADCQCTAAYLFHHVHGSFPKLAPGMDPICYK